MLLSMLEVNNLDELSLNETQVTGQLCLIVKVLFFVRVSQTWREPVM